MNCQDARDRILESFDRPAAPGVDADIERHLAGCPTCAGFARSQQMLDDRLARTLVAPALSPAFRSVLRQRIDRESKPARADSLLELVHFASLGVAILVLAAVLPVDPTAVIGVGVAAALAAYVLLSMVRGSFEDDLLEADR